MRAKTIALAVGLAAAAVFLGFGAGMSVIGISNAILPPFQVADDDTLRERIPVALAYLTWGATMLVILVLGWPWLRRTR